MTVVPVARVRWGFGGGSGMGPDVKTNAEKGAPTSSGSGAGGAVSVTPIGYLDIRTNGAELGPKCASHWTARCWCSWAA